MWQLRDTHTLFSIYSLFFVPESTLLIVLSHMGKWGIYIHTLSHDKGPGCIAVVHSTYLVDIDRRFEKRQLKLTTY